MEDFFYEKEFPSKGIFLNLRDIFFAWKARPSSATHSSRKRLCQHDGFHARPVLSGGGGVRSGAAAENCCVSGSQLQAGSAPAAAAQLCRQNRHPGSQGCVGSCDSDHCVEWYHRRSLLSHPNEATTCCRSQPAAGLCAHHPPERASAGRRAERGEAGCLVAVRSVPLGGHVPTPPPTPTRPHTPSSISLPNPPCTPRVERGQACGGADHQPKRERGRPPAVQV